MFVSLFVYIYVDLLLFVLSDKLEETENSKTSFANSSVVCISINFPSEKTFLQERSIQFSPVLISNFVLISYFFREGRYLLIMTENFAALPRVKQILLEEDSEEPYVIFGSGFPKDQLFTQVKSCFLRFCCYDDSLPIYLSGSLCACLSVCLYISLCFVLDCPFVRLFIYSFLRHINYGSDIFLICNFKIYRFVAISTVSRSVWRPAEQ